MFAAGNSVAPSGTVNYIEDVFSTYLYTGTGSAQTITNGIDLSGQGGLLWTKRRNAASDNGLFDSARGFTNELVSNTTAAQVSGSGVTATSTGFTVTGGAGEINQAGATYASWTFRKQPKFFDIVTYTGTGVVRTVPHNLGSTPGSMIIKRTSAGVTNWHVYHRSLGPAGEIYLNLTAAVSNNPIIFDNTSPTSTEFTVGASDGVNLNGGTYVAYLFAHNAGGFGLTGADNVVSCGSGTVGTEVNLGYEPQFVIMKRTTSTGQWYIIDYMRGWIVSGNDNYLSASSTGAEAAGEYGYPTATGFYPAGIGSAGDPFIYIAIRRGPMKIPTLGTSVFVPTAATNTTGTAVTTNFPIDMQMFASRGLDSSNTSFLDRLRGYPGSSGDTANNRYLVSSSTAAENTTTVMGYNFWNTSYLTGPYYNSAPSVFYSFRRAPGFFDEVCYTGTGSALNHNLGVTPEFIIVKARGTTGLWRVTSVATTGLLYLNATDAKNSTDPFQTLTPCTATTMNLNSVSQDTTNVAYLFATCGGVSKVGSYTGTGGLQTINCGFSSGARFVLIKRTDSTGGWYVWDSARGLSSGTDPYLLLNSTAAEITGTNYVDTDTTGFQVTASAPADINAVGGTYIFLAIA